MMQALLLLAAAFLLVPQRHSRIGRGGVSPRRWNGKLVAAPWGGLMLIAVWLLPLSVVLAVGIAGGTLCVRWRRRRRLRVQSEELIVLESCLEVIVGELRAGAHPVHAFEVTAAELGGTTGEVFAAIASRARLGVTLDPAVPRSGPLAAQWGRISRGWMLAQRHGLAVADLLDVCRTDLQEQQRFTARVNAGLAGPRATAAVLTGLPAAGIGLGQMIGAKPLSVLCAGGLGGVLLVVGVALASVGLLWSDVITAKALR
ncbi:type II secretion system F family protein [Mycobacterium sp. D16R24]|uniref:type II secretion system F family protein n=1 Tax=Mycobacterium sp. D16R24 TaxID=1855656 RepID=UPI0009946981|nr:type II secretion system F family protein [Mycobacterium sp. D16R24]